MMYRADDVSAAVNPLLRVAARREPRAALERREEALHDRAPAAFPARETRSQSSPTSPISAKKMHRQVRSPSSPCFPCSHPPAAGARHSVPLRRNGYNGEASTVQAASSSRAVSSRSRSRTCCRRYMVEYVTCKTCKSPDTLLTKENRIFFMACESCGSRRSVNAIKSGFQAQVGKRSKNKTG